MTSYGSVLLPSSKIVVSPLLLSRKYNSQQREILDPNEGYSQVLTRVTPRSTISRAFKPNVGNDSSTLVRPTFDKNAVIVRLQNEARELQQDLTQAAEVIQALRTEGENHRLFHISTFTILLQTEIITRGALQFAEGEQIRLICETARDQRSAVHSLLSERRRHLHEIESLVEQSTRQQLFRLGFDIPHAPLNSLSSQKSALTEDELVRRVSTLNAGTCDGTTQTLFIDVALDFVSFQTEVLDFNRSFKELLLFGALHHNHSLLAQQSYFVREKEKMEANTARLFAENKSVTNEYEIKCHYLEEGNDHLKKECQRLRDERAALLSKLTLLESEKLRNNNQKKDVSTWCIPFPTPWRNATTTVRLLNSSDSPGGEITVPLTDFSELENAWTLHLNDAERAVPFVPQAALDIVREESLRLVSAKKKLRWQYAKLEGEHDRTLASLTAANRRLEALKTETQEVNRAHQNLWEKYCAIASVLDLASPKTHQNKIAQRSSKNADSTLDALLVTPPAQRMQSVDVGPTAEKNTDVSALSDTDNPNPAPVDTDPTPLEMILVAPSPPAGVEESGDKTDTPADRFPAKILNGRASWKHLPHPVAPLTPTPVRKAWSRDHSSERLQSKKF